MSICAVENVARAVLYEGFMLYPYRPSAIKNQQRWTFGGVFPQAYSDATAGADPAAMQCECLIEGGADARIQVRLGFLHLIDRQVGELRQPCTEWRADVVPSYRLVDAIEIDGRRHLPWQEAMERQWESAIVPLQALASAPQSVDFAFDASCAVEPLRDGSDRIGAVFVRRQRPICGRVELDAARIEASVLRLRVRIVNTSPMQAQDLRARAQATLQALISCHAILSAESGSFLSLMDPPLHLRDAAAACRNLGAWPVLAGSAPDRSMMLAAPIILYDYPQVAAESPGDFFDATEIDEMLTLRILTMTDAEKEEMAAVDPRTRALLERTEALSPAQLERLHGAMRCLRPVSSADAMPDPWQRIDAMPRLAWLNVGGMQLRVGDAVTLRPRQSADIMDLALDGRRATIESIERDFDDRVHVAVTIDDDPGRDLGLARMPGHRFFFAPEELVPAAGEQATR